MPFFQKKYFHRKKWRMRAMVRGKVFQDVDHCASHFDLNPDHVRRMITGGRIDCTGCAELVYP